MRKWGRKRRLLRLKEDTFKGLQFGCGEYYKSGWINVDFANGEGIDFVLDITDRNLPLPSGYFDALYGSEVIEHIELAQARRFLREALRILKPGGVLRMTTPDIIEVCKIYLGRSPEASMENFRTTWLEGEFSPEIWINAMFGAWGHKHLYTFESLSTELLAAGFINVRRCAPQETGSGMEQLRNLEDRYGPNPPAWIFAPVVILEADKPR